MEREALVDKAKALEAWVVKLEGEHSSLQDEVWMLQGIRVDLEMEIQAEWELSHSVALATWEALDLGTLPPSRRQSVGKMDITLGRLCRTEEVCLLVSRAYGDHCAKVAWTTTFASLQKAGCGHLDTLATRSLAVATTEEVAARQCKTRKASNVFVQDFWASCGRDGLPSSSASPEEGQGSSG